MTVWPVLALNSLVRIARPGWFLAFALLLTHGASPPAAAEPAFSIANPQPALAAVRAKYKLPALGTAIVTDEGLQMVATTGVRKRGDATRVTDDDHWHLGSCGKAITATMIARLVEAGKLSFEQTLGETFPELNSKMSQPMQQIKLVDLLSHTSGMPANFNVMNYIPKESDTEKHVARARRKVLREALSAELLSAPGEQHLYSNWGYTLAGHMAEKATGKSWESLVRLEVFKPLGMASAGFGGSGTSGKIDQPWPHFATGAPAPANGKAMDNVPAMGPAGTIHMSLSDWGKFIGEHLKGHRGKSKYLKQATFAKLHTIVKDDYALGWASMPRNWAGGNALFHNGDNTMNHAIVWAAPKKGFAVLVTTNQSMASRACDDIAAGLIDAWMSGGEAHAGNASKPAPSARRDNFAKLAPFNAIRWEKTRPIVRVGKQWYRLLALDGVPASEIVEYSRMLYGSRWQKRIAEDLVELLSKMGHPPGDTVKLELQSLKSKATRVIAAAPMTAANRAAIKAGAGTEAAIPAGSSGEVDAEHRRRLVGRYQLAPNFVFDVQDRSGRLMVGVTNQPTQEVFADSPTRWSYRTVDAALEFQLGKTGPARSLVLHQSGMKQKARRVK